MAESPLNPHFYGIHNAQKEYDHAYQQAQQQLAPYTQHAGPDFNAYRGAIGNQYQGLGPAYQMHQSAMGMTPRAILNSAEGGYQMSPYAQYQLDQAQKGEQHAAASGGMLGTPEDQRRMAELTQSIISKDQQQDFSNLYDIGQFQGNQYNADASRLANLANAGIGREYGAANTLAQIPGQFASNKADLEQYKGAKRHDQIKGATKALSRLAKAAMIAMMM